MVERQTWMEDISLRTERCTYMSGDGNTQLGGYVSAPDGPGPHPAVLILRGVQGPKTAILKSRTGSPTGATSRSCMAGRSVATIRPMVRSTTTSQAS